MDALQDRPQKSPSVAHSAVKMALGTLSSRVLGFIRDALIFALFPRMVTDAFAVAFRIPNMFRRLFGEGSLTVSFIPVYIRFKVERPGDAKALANAVWTILLLSMSFAATVMYFYMPDILNFLVGNKEGFAATPGKMEMTLLMSRIMISYLVLVTSYAFMMGVANAEKSYFIPAFAPALFNVGAIAFSLIPNRLVEFEGAQLATGVIFGGVLQLVCMAVHLYRQGWWVHLTLKWNVAGLGKVFRNMVPGLWGLGGLQVVTLLNTYFASRLPEGTQSYMYAADRVLELPQSLIAISLGSVLLTSLSEELSQKNMVRFKETIEKSMKLLLFLSLPSAVGMVLMAGPITEVLFQRGSFNSLDTLLTSQVVAIYSLLLLASGLQRMLAPAFYAAHNTWLPAAVTTVCVCIHAVLGNYLVNEWGLPGLAFATSLLSVFNLLLLGVAFYFYFGALNVLEILYFVLRVTPALIVLGVVAWGGWYVLADLFSGGLWRGAVLFFVIGLSALVYFGVCSLLKINEANMVLRRLKRKKV